MSSVFSDLSPRAALQKRMTDKKSFLCVGLDTDLSCLPSGFEPTLDVRQRITAFNKIIVRATRSYSVAYKLNTAFYEAEGHLGYQALEESVQIIRSEAPEALIIMDAKRGDIANSAAQYAKAFFQHLDADAVTLSPFMGRDSILPFLAYEQKWIILLAATSNAGFESFQNLRLSSGLRLWEQVLKACSEWSDPDRLMFVVGATRGSEVLAGVRRILPHHFLLIPGVGTQGGTLSEVYTAAQGSVLVNASRSILYATKDANAIGETAARQAAELQKEMQNLLESDPQFSAEAQTQT